MDPTSIKCDDVIWFHVVQDRVQWLVIINTVMNLLVLYKAGNFVTSRASVSFIRRILLNGIILTLCNIRNYVMGGV
jgi:hypothetical protein